MKVKEMLLINKNYTCQCHRKGEFMLEWVHASHDLIQIGIKSINMWFI